MTKLNIGCGTDYREGFINIDGSGCLSRVDKVVDISSDSLRNYFEKESADYILANDILEHHFHWEAVNILKDLHSILTATGTLEIRVPDAEYIIKSWKIPLNQKLTLLFGGQDIPQGRDSEMDESRKIFPQFFCHKFGWTMKLMKNELLIIGFSDVHLRRAGTNFIAKAIK